MAITLDEGDTLIGVKLTTGKQDLILGTEQGKAIRFSEEDVRSMGRVTRGVKGITLKNNDKVRGMVVVDEQASLMAICENGFGKRTDFGEYSAKNRGGQGVINIKTTERNGKVVALIDIRENDELIMITKGGKIIRTPVNTIRVIGRNTQGVKLFDIDKTDKLISVARVVPEENPPQEEMEAESESETEMEMGTDTENNIPEPE